MTANSDITPELARRVLTHLEHSKYIGPDGGLNALFTVRDAVENWETDVGSNDLAARLAASMLNAHEGHAHAYENAMGRWREAWDGHARVALEFLASIGRLIPAGGMALTPEQVEDVRLLLGLNGSQDIKVVLDAQARLRALFPATEPGEVSGNIFAEGNSSPKVVHVHHHDIEAHAASFNEGYDEAMRQLAEPVDTIRNFPRCGHYLDEARCTRRIHDGDHEVAQGDEVIVWPAGEPDPEPAEEEAEAEAQQLRDLSTALRAALGILDPLEGGGWAHAWQTVDDLDDCANRISSPVVPAPSKTGPWPSIEKVPTGLVVIGTNGERFMGCPCESETHGYANQFAPFVAMKER